MSSYKLSCKICGVAFYPTQEEKEMFEEGFCELPKLCDECFKDQNEDSTSYLPDTFDSDSGL